VRESDAGLEIVRLTNLGTVIAQRVAGAVDARLLDRGVDPTLERRVERLVDDTFNELVIEGDVPSGIDETRVKALVVSELCGVGPLSPLLDDESVQAIAVSGRGHIAVQRAGQLSARELPFLLAESLPRAVTRLLRRAGVDVGAVPGGVSEYSLDKLGFELQVLGSDVVPAGAAFSLSRRESVGRTLEDLVRSGVISRTMATFLRHCLTAQVNLLVVGPARSGADEVMSALAAAVEGDRVLGLPSVERPGVSYDNVTWLKADEAAAQDVLLRAGRLVGHRILVDGLSAPRALATLSAIAEGAQGALVRLSARSIERGLARLCAELSLERPGVTPFVAAEAVVSAFDLALEVARLPDGRSRVLRIAELERGDDALIKGVDVFDFAVERTATGGSIEGTFRNTGHTPQLVAELRSQGVRLDPALLSRPPASDDRR
jgi:pilus assembly protein CpaF